MSAVVVIFYFYVLSCLVWIVEEVHLKRSMRTFFFFHFLFIYPTKFHKISHHAPSLLSDISAQFWDGSSTTKSSAAGCEDFMDLGRLCSFGSSLTVLQLCYILYLPPLCFFPQRFDITNSVTGLPANRCLTVGNMKNNKLLFDFPAHTCSAESSVVNGNDLSSVSDADSVISFIPYCCYLSPDFFFSLKVRGQVT